MRPFYIPKKQSTSNLPTSVMVCLVLFSINSICGQEYVQVGNDIDGQITSEASGLATTLSADGTTLAVGSNFMGNTGLSEGLVRVYTFDGADWTQLGWDIVGENLDDEFGSAVSLNEDGTIIAIGTPENSDALSRAGHVRVYQWNTTTWEQLGADIDGTEANEQFGESVALSHDGRRMIAGAIGGNTNGSLTGLARVYEFDGTDWMQVGNDLAGAQGDRYGYSVGMDSSGDRIAISGPLSDANGFNTGKVEVFEWSNSSWNQIGNTLNGTVASAFGISIDLSDDGSALAIGGPACGDPDTQGLAWVYILANGQWELQGDPVSGSNMNSCFGDSVALDATGDRLVVGDPVQGPNGLTRVFEFDATDWVQVGGDILGESKGDLSGRSVSMSANGARVSMGANANSDGAIGGGQTRVFQDDSLLFSSDFELSPSAITMYPNPASSMLHLQFQENATFTKVALYDMQGRMILTQALETTRQSTAISLGTLQSGMYQVVISGSDRTLTKKLLKK